AAGHDVTAQNNRIVSCGVTANGQWYAIGRPAAYIWNYYNSNAFYNNTLSGTTGGVLAPDGKGGTRTAGDWMANEKDRTANNKIQETKFSNPCLVNGKVNLRAEDEERALWAAKLAAHRQTVGAR
ncbi:MAG: hypothetical protein P4L40_13840, partial [Terracidiphilus sp.]|nr:hypothetical protein [Terracidiphilus sp.]